MMTKDEARLILIRAQLTTLEARLKALRQKESILLSRIGYDPSKQKAKAVDEQELKVFISSGKFLERMEEISKMLIDAQMEELSEIAAGWKPLSRV